MNREQLLNMLERLVREDTLTTGEAGRILRAFDAGQIGPEDLPLPPARSAILLDEAAAAAALQDVASRLPVSAERIRVIPIDRKRRFVVEILDDMNSRSFQAARRYAQGGTVRNWHQTMKDIVRDDLVQQATLGKGRALNAQEMARLQEVADEQAGYLKKFAEEVAARDAAGNPMSEAQIRSRAEMYRGRGYEQFWRLSEEEASTPDTIVRYVAIDDNRTCGPCIEAENGGPYLPGEEHPYPGQVCLGRGHCRCRLEYVTDPERANELRGQAVPA